MHGRQTACVRARACKMHLQVQASAELNVSCTPSLNVNAAERVGLCDADLLGLGHSWAFCRLSQLQYVQQPLWAAECSLANPNGFPSHRVTGPGMCCCEGAGQPGARPHERTSHVRSSVVCSAHTGQWMSAHKVDCNCDL